MARTVSEDVFTLIKSLSKPEKRYFRFYASMGNTNENMIYLKLFDAIETQKNYNEKKLLKKIPELKPIRISAQKNYLGELILESLQWYHSQRSVNAKLRSFISNIEILFSKRLFKQCSKQIVKAKELAQHYEKHQQLSELIQWEEKVISSTLSSAQDGARINKLLAENISLIEMTQTEARYKLLIDKFFDLFRREGSFSGKETKERLRKLIQHPLLKKYPRSFHERNLYHRIFQVYYYMSDNWKKYNESLQLIIKDFESNPQQIEESPVVYLNTLNNYMISSRNTHTEKEFNVTLQKVNRIEQNSTYANNKNVRIALLLCHVTELDTYSMKGEFKKGIPLSARIEETLGKQGEMENKIRRVPIYYAFAYNYFGAGNFKRTLFWVNKILNDPDTNIRNDFQVFTRLLNILTHFELGNEKELEYFTRSTYRFLLRIKREHKIEGIILRFIRKKIHNANSKKELLTAFGELKSQIEMLAQDPAEEEALRYFDFVSWLESKIQGKDFAEVVKEKWKGS